MITDVRDVVFQASPFKGLKGDYLFLFQGNNQFMLRLESINWNWLTEAYGLDSVRHMAPLLILCSGTTIGSYSSSLQYLRVMCDELARLSPRVIGKFGFDQAALNFLYRSNCLPGAVVKSSFLGPVATLVLEKLR